MHELQGWKTLTSNILYNTNLPYWQKLSQKEKVAKSRISFFSKVGLDAIIAANDQMSRIAKFLKVEGINIRELKKS